LTLGERFAGYRIVGEIGAGGMGQVYLVEHPRLPRREALKILRADISADEGFRQRFIREADSVAALEHPHIVTVYDRGDTEGRLWIATQYVDGTDAARLLGDRYPAGMPAGEAAAITAAISGALDYAHDQRLLHRDVKPANILVARPDREGNQRVYLADFGIARPLDDPAGLTATNFTLGTVAYAAPEQLMGQDIDGRADQYALAATTFHLLTGTTPFANTNPVTVIGRHLTEPAPAPSSIRPDLAGYDAVFARALAKSPEDRFPRCQDFAREITAAAARSDTGYSSTAPTQAAPVQAAEPAVIPNSRRSTVLAILAAVVILSLLTAAALLWRPWRDSDSIRTGENSAVDVAPPTASSAPATTTTAKQVILPNAPPPNSGCGGTISAYHDIEHPALGPMRIFLLSEWPAKKKDAGCVSAVTASGAALPPIVLDSIGQFAFAVPATDATGNTFINYNSVKYFSVLVLVPTEYGFADIGWKYDGHAEGRYAFHYAKLSGPGADGRYTITHYTRHCSPDCATGGSTSEELRWNGSEYTP